MNHLDETHLSVPKIVGRKRGLSVSTVSRQDQINRENVLDTLQEDLSIVSENWGKLLVEETNPLELAMFFLDDTSVGLEHRYGEFKELKNKIENDLQEAVNEHYQAFNSNIASYRDVVSQIQKAQDSLGMIKKVSTSAVENITKKHEDLSVLNEEHMKQSKVIENLNALKELQEIPLLIDSDIAEKKFSSAQTLLDKAYKIAATYNLWSLEATSLIRHQLDIQKKSLFEILVEEISSMIYVKNPSSAVQQLFGFPKVNDVQFNDLENYLYQLVNIDITERSNLINSSILQFLKNLGSNPIIDTSFLSEVESVDNIYQNIHHNLIVIHNMNELPSALRMLVNKINGELHNISVKSTDNVRVLHPAVMKILSSTNNSEISVRSMGPAVNVVYLVLKEYFWDIFSKYLFVLQAHSAVFEISRALSSPGSNIQYDITSIWKSIMTAVSNLLDNYIVNVKSLLKVKSSSSTINEKLSKPFKKEGFSLNAMTEQSSRTRGHVDEMSRLLKDMLPGFDGTDPTNSGDIYLHDIVTHSDEALIKPSAFNMRFILAPFLLFTEGSSKIMYPSISEKTLSPVDFFQKYMENQFFNELSNSLNVSYSKILDVVNPYLLEQTDGNEGTVFKIFSDFKDFFVDLLFIFNTSNNCKPPIFNLLIEYLKRFLTFGQHFFNTIISKDITPRSLLSIWINDQQLLKLTQKVYDDPDIIGDEIRSLMSHCSKFYESQTKVIKTDFLSTASVENITHFIKTITWFIKWLGSVKNAVPSTFEVSTEDIKLLNVEKMKRYWSLEEYLGSNDNTNSVLFAMTDNENKIFDQLVKGYKDILNVAMVHLRYNLRAESIFYISGAINSVDWCSEPTTTKISESVLLLNSNISCVSNFVKNLVSIEQYEFIFMGLPDFFSNILVLASFGLSALNSFGYKSLMKNFEILQNCVKNLSISEEEDGIEDALGYYELFHINENRLVEAYNSGQYEGLYSYDLIRNMLRLIFSESIREYQIQKNPKNINMSSKPVTKRLDDFINKLKR